MIFKYPFSFYLDTEIKFTFPLLSVFSSLISKEQRNLIVPSNDGWLFDDWPKNDAGRRGFEDWFVVGTIVRRNAFPKLANIR